MAVLGKRKASEPSSVSQDDAEEIFRRHFEAQFAPIESSASKRRAGSRDEDDEDDDSTAAGTAGTRRQGISDNDNDEESEWGGFSEDDREDGVEDSDDEDAEDGDEAAIQVVDHSASQTPKPAAMSKRELKAFMSSRPPDHAATTSKPSAAASTQSSSTTLPEDAPSLLAQDLELRRLISESHLLTSAKPSSSSSASFFSSGLLNEPKLFTNGRIRQKATDMRVQALGSKDSILTQKSMPMNMRKGIVAAATAKETKRRKEARENGVILERENKSKGKARKSSRSRDTGIDMPGMGRFRGAELKLNDREVQRIEGSRDVFGRRNGGRRR